MHKPPNIVGVGSSSDRVLRYVDVSVVISDVEVRNPLIVVDELAYPLLIGTDVLRPHRAIFELGALYVVRLKLDRFSVCVDQRLPDSTPRVIVGAVALNPCRHDVAPTHREPCTSSPTPQSTRRLAFSRGASATRTCNRIVRRSPLGVRNHRCHSRSVCSELVRQGRQPLLRHSNRGRVLSDVETIVAVVQLR